MRIAWAEQDGRLSIRLQHSWVEVGGEVGRLLGLLLLTYLCAPSQVAPSYLRTKNQDHYFGKFLLNCVQKRSVRLKIESK